MNLFEDLIATVAPRLAVKRAQARMALVHIRAYEGAGKGRRLDGWKTISSSANTETRISLAILRNRARDLVRNNPYAARGLNAIATNLVGYGIKTTVVSPNKRVTDPLTAAWKSWAETTDCDADGVHDMYGLQLQAARCMAESGEVLIRRVWRKGGQYARLSVPFQIQVLEPDYLDTSRDGTNSENGNTISQGVEFSPSGQRVAFWLFEQHPGDQRYVINSKSLYASKRVLATDIKQIFRADRAGQVRGITWFAPVMLRMRDFDEFEDAQLVRQKIAACFSAFVSDVDAPEITGAKKKADDFIEKMEPGIIEFLPPGKTITMANPPGVEGYGEYCSVTLHGIASGLGVPYETITGDYSQVNFTSARMARSEFYAMLDVWQWLTFIPMFCKGNFDWFLEGAALAGMSTKGATGKYTPPRRTLVDPTREIPAIIKAVRGGLQTLFSAIREMGYDPEEFLAEYKAGLELIDKLGIVLDSDPRKTTNGGQVQQPTQENNDPPDGQAE